MVRTKAGSVSTKAVGGKAPQKVAARAVAAGSVSKSKHTGGNSYHPRETPEWQKPITFFMKQDGESAADESGEVSGLPGIPGTEVNCPQALGMKKKVRDKRDGGSSNESEKKAEHKKTNREDDMEIDVKETVKGGKYENQDGPDFDKEVEKKMEEIVDGEDRDEEDEIYDMDKAMDVKENVKNDEEIYSNAETELDDERRDTKNTDDRKNVGGSVVLDKAKEHDEEGLAAGSAAEDKQDKVSKDEVNFVESMKIDEDKVDKDEDLCNS